MFGDQEPECGADVSGWDTPMWSEASAVSVDCAPRTLAVLRLVTRSYNPPGVGLNWSREDGGALGGLAAGGGGTLREEC